MPIITLTTDFGTRDGYVGAVKGVITRLVTEVTILDLAHDIPRGDIAHAAWVVLTSTREFPHGTIHLAVVDPGVGGVRRDVIVKTRGQWYVAPDNGTLAYVVDPSAQCWAITTKRFRTRNISPTFHGRDVLAHAAAMLARGGEWIHAGPTIELAGTLPWGPRPADRGRIVHVDVYGNLISDLPAAEAGEAVMIAGHTLRLVRTYEDVAPGDLLAYIGSARTVEIAVRDGRADTHLQTARGTPVVPAGPVGLYR